MTDNVFNIDNPKLYVCNVYKYDSNLSKLYIRVFKGRSTQASFYLFFSDVGYFEGPMNWQGAEFRTASTEACFTLMRNAGVVEPSYLDDPDMQAALAEAAHLYEVETLHSTVRIIAGSAIMMREIPTSNA